VEERRRDIIAATVPLLETEGFSVSTKRIADAAGIAEGTVFRVFPTKEDLLRAAMTSYMDLTDLIDKIDVIDPALPVEDKISEIIDVVQESATRVRTFMLAMRGRRIQAAHSDTNTERVRPGATFLNGLGLRNRVDQPSTDDVCEHGLPDPHRTFTVQAASFMAAIEKVLAANEDDFIVDLPTAATYIVSTGLTSLIVSTAFPTMGAASIKTLTLRALTDHRKDQS